VGILLNAVSGFSIFMTEATRYVTNVPFIVKMIFVAAGSVSLVATQRLLRRTVNCNVV
jgi:hypothetical protein